MDRLNELLQELGVSKVRLAKYLGVSRQMVYNYLTFDSLDKWPKEKKLLLFQLLGIEGNSEDDIKKVKVDTEYLMVVERRLSNSLKRTGDGDTIIDLKGLDKENRILLSDITYLLKEKLEDNKVGDVKAIKYLYMMLQIMPNVPEVKYMFGYFAKISGIVNHDDFAFNEGKQFAFESILYSALSLYNNGGASKSKLMESRKRFIQEIEQKQEEKLSRTQQLNTTKIQALKELGLTEINEHNAQQVFEKIAEIESR